MQNANQKCKPNRKFKVFSSDTILKIFFCFASVLHFASVLQFSIFLEFFPTHFILQCKMQNANQKCKPNRKFKVFSSDTILKIFFSFAFVLRFAFVLHFASVLQFSIFFYFSNPLYFAVQNAKRKPKV